MNDAQIASNMFKLAHALEWIHGNGYIHRDLAGRNVLYHKTSDVVKIVDFGLSQRASSIPITAHTKITVRWAAPELLTSYQ